jgi:hypothetical protein
MKTPDILLRHYIQPAIVKMLFDDSGNLKKTDVLRKITVSVNGNKKTLADIANGLPEGMRKAPQDPVFDMSNPTAAQQATITENTMFAVNYILGTLQGVVVSGQNFLNYVNKELVGGPAGWIQFSNTDAQNLEVIRKRLSSETLTIVDIAKLFELQGEDIVPKGGVAEAISKVQIDGLSDRITEIATELKTELKRGAEAHGTTFEAEFEKLQAGKMPNWYDFDFLNKQNPKAVEMFKSCMSTVTDYIITAVTMMKDFINYGHSFYKSDQKFVSKNSDELFDTLARQTKGESSLLWTELAQTIKVQGQAI